MVSFQKILKWDCSASNCAFMLESSGLLCISWGLTGCILTQNQCNSQILKRSVNQEQNRVVALRLGRLATLNWGSEKVFLSS